MIERLKIHLRAAENLTWRTSDFEATLEEAARRMWRHIAASPAARCLRSFAQSSLGAEMAVEIPSDCLRVERVEARKDSGRPWIELAYALPGDLEENSPWGLRRLHAAWTDDQAERTIRVIGLAAGAAIRIQYIQEPVFPFEDDGTFRRPDAGSSDTYPGIPELCDSACEHLAAALMSGEELSDGDPISYHGQQYTALLRNIAGAPSVRPSRSYVRRTRR
ncbi:MAG: hypothetical protein IJJ33_04420 [Victivallales bacterium]|nr:hypothetical protein [Victivallales bacterium]